MSKETNPSAILKTLMGQQVKLYTIFDGSLRAWKVYQAPTEAKDQAVCLVTEYAYQGLTSIIVGTKEAEGVWDGSWDAIFTV